VVTAAVILALVAAIAGCGVARMKREIVVSTDRGPLTVRLP
jgi:hypothetical protein